MSSTMLQLIQQAAGEMGLAVPTYVAGNAQADVVQQLALLNACGREISRAYIWQALSKQYIITVSYTSITGNTTSGSTSLTNCSSISGIDTTYQISGTGINQATYVAASPTGSTIVLSQPATSTNVGATYTLGKVKYTMPSDYDRQIDRTHWDKSKHWEMLGPETAQQWEWLISGYISTGPRIRYRIFNSYFQIWPLVTTAEVIGFEYISNAWANNAAGTAKTTFTVDTDTCIFPDNLMVLALKKKYFEVKGFDASAFTRDYMTEMSIAKANDGGSLTLSMNPRISTILIGWEQIPDSGYGS
jgi:hypothetical protein